MNLEHSQTYEIKVNGEWVQVTEYIFRSWTGSRRLSDEQYDGPVFFLGTDQVSRPWRDDRSAFGDLAV